MDSPLVYSTSSVLVVNEKERECRVGRGRLAMRILSVCLSNVCIVTKWKKDLSRFLYHTKYLVF